MTKHPETPEEIEKILQRGCEDEYVFARPTTKPADAE
jgi:hypothetical protein